MAIYTAFLLRQRNVILFDSISALVGGLGGGAKYAF